MKNNFLKKLQNFIFQEKFLERGDKVIVGVSGGPDSIGLALALKKLQEKYQFDLELVHVNYHQRGEESRLDEKFVRDFAEENDLTLKVIDYEEKPKNNLEERMRDFRYGEFEKIRKDLGYDKIAVAHHADDQAETFLMNLLRGAGLSGLSGMKFKKDFLIRPFLGFSKEEILGFLKESDQKYRIDNTNLETDFTRNKIRLELVPFLEKKFDFRAGESLGRLTKNFQDENELLKFFIEDSYGNLVEKRDKKVIWNISNVQNLPVGGLKRLFRRTILDLKGDLKNITNNNFLEFKKIFDSQKSKNQTMGIGEIVLKKSGNHVIFSKVSH